MYTEEEHATLTSITLSDAEVKAKAAVDVVINAIRVSVLEHVHEIFDGKEEQSHIAQKVASLLHDDYFRDKLESSFMAWLLKTHVILPPTRLES